MKGSVRAIAFVALVLIAALAWWFWHVREAKASASVEHGESVPAQVAHARALQPRFDAPDQPLEQVATRLAVAKKRPGHDDAVVRDLESIAMSACGRMEVATGRAPSADGIQQPSLSALRRDPSRAWALDYLERACAGYDASAALKAWRVEVPDLMLADEFGAEQANSVALDDLRTSNSITELLLAFEHLRRANQLPEGMVLRHGNGVDSTLRVIQFAVEPIRCAGIGSCSGDSLETAWHCLDNGCPRGITLDQILRADMPPAEVTAGLALREELMRYRTSPN